MRRRRIVRTVYLFTALLLLISVVKLACMVSPILAAVVSFVLALVLFMYYIVLVIEHRNRW